MIRARENIGPQRNFVPRSKTLLRPIQYPKNRLVLDCARASAAFPRNCSFTALILGLYRFSLGPVIIFAQ